MAGFGSSVRVADEATVDERVDFIRKTYLHLGGAVLAFTALTTILVRSFGDRITPWMLGGAGNWAIVLVAFMVCGWIAERLARSGASPAVQYAGLALYVVAESVIFVPLLWLAAYYTPPEANVIPTAGILTATVFGGLTAFVFISKKDFSFMRQALMIATFAAMGLIVCSMIFGFKLEMLFSVGMVVLAGGWILYRTSNVMRHYPIGSHVAASLALFADLALLFWYILRIVMELSRRN